MPKLPIGAVLPNWLMAKWGESAFVNAGVAGLCCSPELADGQVGRMGLCECQICWFVLFSLTDSLARATSVVSHLTIASSVSKRPVRQLLVLSRQHAGHLLEETEASNKKHFASLGTIF